MDISDGSIVLKLGIVLSKLHLLIYTFKPATLQDSRFFCLSVLPMYKDSKINSTFDVYDKKLKLITSFEYASNYGSMTSWLVPLFSNGEHRLDTTGFKNELLPPPPEVWHPMAKKFSNDFRSLILQNK